jgi:hypothetical protein
LRAQTVCRFRQNQQLFASDFTQIALSFPVTICLPGGCLFCVKLLFTVTVSMDRWFAVQKKLDLFVRSDYYKVDDTGRKTAILRHCSTPVHLL